ncbi:hypothetical protein CMT56_13560 [Elizabethkingia anophelis]|nr:hypothetical protein [Elizabethkingia anophelis]MDV3909288.1 hypothetical protein [Elizabethkingia anophelis]MDV3922746.1 hypothetical protein [Elizabethkingia anophelis]MDV3989044.1 hypothetical protein [Elizabethkingia anophelis]
MKRTFGILAIAVAVLGTFSVSCSRSDNNNETEHPSPKYDVTGIWDILSMTDIIGTNHDLQGKNYFIQMNANNTCKINYAGETADGTYVYDGKDKITITTPKGKTYLTVKKVEANNMDVEVRDETSKDDYIVLKMKRK